MDMYEDLELKPVRQANGTQVWRDRENNMKILFTYLPENPVINTPTQLKFSVDNLRTGVNMKNLLAMVVKVIAVYTRKLSNLKI